MTNRQENKLNMYLAVKSFLENNNELVKNLPNYAIFLNDFNSAIIEIKAAAKEQLFDKKGVMNNKKQLKIKLSELAIDTSRKLIAFAKFTNNLILLNEINYSESELKRSSSSKLMEQAQGIHTRAQNHIDALEPYGINAALQDKLQATINDFMQYIPKPRIAIASVKQFTARLEKAIKKADTALKNIDIAVEIIRITQTGFYNEYKSVRKIINNGVGALTLVGQVVEAKSNRPVKNATLVFTKKMNGNDDDNVVVSITKKSAERGGFQIKSMPDGLYKVDINKNGYAKQEVEVAINQGELFRMNVELMKN